MSSITRIRNGINLRLQFIFAEDLVYYRSFRGKSEVSARRELTVGSNRVEFAGKYTNLTSAKKFKEKCIGTLKSQLRLKPC